MHSKLFSAATVGVNAKLVQVEVDISNGFVNFYIVGLPDAAIRESSKRIIAAVKNSGFKVPPKKIVVNLAPADLKKEGTLFDLPIAIGIIMSLNLLEISKEFIEETLFIGELSLDGEISFIKGALAIAYDAKKLNKKRIILPKANAKEAALIEGLEVIGVENITELVAYLRNEHSIEATTNSFSSFVKNNLNIDVDFSQIKGQLQAKRALQIAAAGRHNILFVGPPGAGKTMLAKRLQTIMPEMTFDEVLQTSKIYSICGKLGKKPLITQRPFRSPHHTTSQAGLVGGGTYPQPGEISLSHNGILFLDELTEFKRDVLEVIRQPLENKTVCISRVNQTLTFPANFLLIAALNPCPCGYLGDKKKTCHCTKQQVNKYLDKLSGPLLDRIDLQISVQSVEYDTIKEKNIESESSASMFEKVLKAVTIQEKRFGTKSMFNANMNPDQIDKFCQLTESAEITIKKAFEVLSLSMRGYHKILKVARTMADLDGYETIDTKHIREAVMYRSLDQSLDKQRA